MNNTELNDRTSTELNEQNDNIDCERIYTRAELNEELLTAIENNSLEQVKSLVEQGADVNYKDEDDDWTPLMYAVMSSMSATISYNLEIIKFLIDNGADVNAKDLDGDTALKYAVNKGDLNLVKLLIEHGADIEIKDQFGYTALMRACNYNFEIAKLLIEHGADVNVKSECLKKTPLMLCCESRENWIPTDKVLELIKYLIERGADVNAKDDDGNTALKMAIEYDKKEVVKFLILKGADVNLKNINGRTPLMVASNYARFEIAKWLIINGADVNAKDKDGKTALMYAKNIEMKNYLKMAMGKQKLSQLTLHQSTKEIEEMMPLIDFDYSDFNRLKKEVEKLNLATNKTIDLSLALANRVKYLQEDSLLNAQHINVIRHSHQKQIDKIYSILRKHITDTNNFIMEFAEEYDKENSHIKELKCKQKGFICRFFDRFTRRKP